MAEQSATGLYWFRHDLRLDDNPALSALAASVSRLICVYVVDPAWFRETRWQARPLGPARWKFLYESLLDLQHQLESLGQHLHVCWGRPAQVIVDLVQAHGVTQLGASRHPGPHEIAEWQAVQAALPALSMHSHDAHTLYTPERLPFRLSDLPATFSAFRRQVEKAATPRPPESEPDSLPPPPAMLRREWPQTLPYVDFDAGADWVGGSRAGLAQLDTYLYGSHRVQRYKQTRNHFDDLEGSSRLAAWLGNGALSAARVWHTLRSYENQVAANESTYWLGFELLWREYFQWSLYQHGNRLFAFSGVRRRRPLTTFYPAYLKAWQAGETGLPLVDACMRQLAATGWMSNRGRQIVASALVNELNLDWRYGAAWFEQQLVDFDVAANYGNWQYLAGVGADPRGQRHFDLERQARQYDPDGAFVARWVGADSVPVAGYAVDAADWPCETDAA